MPPRLVVLLAVAVFVPACSSQPVFCPANNTCEETLADVHVLDGTMSFGIEDAGITAYSLSDPSSPCSAAVAAVPGMRASVTVRCSVASVSDFDVTVDLPDLASLVTLGPLTFTTDQIVNLTRTDGGPTCSGQFHPFDITVTLEAAQGGLAPPAVSPDYMRTVRIDVPVRRTTEGTPYNVCPAYVTTPNGFSLRVQQSASDVHHRADAPCPCAL